MKHQISYRQLQYFTRVAELLHFRKAAASLYVSQPGLSRQIKQLEEELGVILFERHSRKVALTHAGQYLKEQMNFHFRQLEDIFSQTQFIHAGIRGHLRIGYVGSAMQSLIPDLLVGFERDSPDIQINLQELDNQLQIKALINQEIDIGFVRMERVPLGLMMHRAEEETFSLVLPQDHKMDSNTFVDLEQLKEESWILFDPSYSESYYEKVMQIFDLSSFRPKISHLTVNASSIYRLVEHGFGISIVPTSLTQGYRLRIKFIELKTIPQRTALKIVWNRNNTNPALHRFIQGVKEVEDQDSE